MTSIEKMLPTGLRDVAGLIVERWKLIPAIMLAVMTIAAIRFIVNPFGYLAETTFVLDPIFTVDTDGAVVESPALNYESLRRILELKFPAHRFDIRLDGNNMFLSVLKETEEKSRRALSKIRANILKRHSQLAAKNRWKLHQMLELLIVEIEELENHYAYHAETDDSPNSGHLAFSPLSRHYVDLKREKYVIELALLESTLLNENAEHQVRVTDLQPSRIVRYLVLSVVLGLALGVFCALLFGIAGRLREAAKNP